MTEALKDRGSQGSRILVHRAHHIAARKRTAEVQFDGRDKHSQKPKTKKEDPFLPNLPFTSLYFFPNRSFRLDHSNLHHLRRLSNDQLLLPSAVDVVFVVSTPEAMAMALHRFRGSSSSNDRERDRESFWAYCWADI